MKRFYVLYPLSYGPVCWSRWDSNPRPRPLMDVVPPGIRHKNCSADAARQSVARRFLSYSACAEPGHEPGPPSFWPGALPCSPAGIRAAKSLSKINSAPTTDRLVFAETLQCDVVPSGIRPAKFFPFCPAMPFTTWPGFSPFSLASLQSSTDSITPTQCSALRRPSAKAAMTSNTWSENPPMFKMSSRSAACVVP